jgi:hypothetical protein
MGLTDVAPRETERRYNRKTAKLMRRFRILPNWRRPLLGSELTIYILCSSITVLVNSASSPNNRGQRFLIPLRQPLITSGIQASERARARMFCFQQLFAASIRPGACTRILQKKPTVSKISWNCALGELKNVARRQAE